MTGRGNPHDDLDSSDSVVDFDLLDLILERLCDSDRFQSAKYRPHFAPESVVLYPDAGFYPSTVAEVKLKVKWFENGDFSIHYQENYEEGVDTPGEESGFSHRWDRHPNAHNSYDHIHPGPDAPTPGKDADHPQDWRDVLSKVIGEIDERRNAFWE